ncbi:AraC family transcriptional regulator [Phyllobacterium salinisoli]|uniref:AraC family transcriptional regulator n=1 Tax=Phyllobacterium salinisoli TaxID=1899321 RepID=A0A368JWE7_9HYPH|nr:AraC family transcriptional regulator [Phyllobacterium salinisoli]RCS21496.1 AraC family transcriptional regulator [Phyllobacterium salinisoli]
MPSVPLPFVTALLLIILFVRLIRQSEPALRSATVFVGVCALLSAVVGLRWTFDSQAFRFIQPIAAALLPASAWLAFAQLAGRRMLARKWVHVVPIALVIVLSATWMQLHPPIDLVLALIFFGYGIAILRLSLKGVDTFGAARLADAPTARNAAAIVGFALILTGIIDVLLAGDFGFYRGAHSALIVAIANMLMLPVIAYAIAMVGLSAAPADAMENAEEASIHSNSSEASDADYTGTLEAIDRLMREKKLFRDPDLTLDRLARRALIPARQISAAINRAHGKNVSQSVNDYRIEEAKSLLLNTNLPITSIIFDVGFHTKSNFNREFLRLTGMTPSGFRERNELNRTSSPE